MASLTQIEPNDQRLSKIQYFAGVGVQLIPKCCCDRHGWVDPGWRIRRIRVKKVQLVNPEEVEHRFIGINVETSNPGWSRGM